jgi:hypothetical protein
MKAKSEKDVVAMFQHFQQHVLENKPSLKDMISEVRMMQFKIRPVEGDITALNFKNYSFIETLWSLGKLDEFFLQHESKLKKSDKIVFYRLFDGLYEQYRNKLNHINLKKDQYDEGKVPSGFEVEIFREKSKKSN